MATKLGLRLAPAACRLSAGAPVASIRALSSLAGKRSPALLSQRTTVLPRLQLQQSFRRSYADAPKAQLSPSPKPKKRFRILRFLWRLTYLSALGFAGYVAYQIWYLRNPTEQFEPDPKKKTLVVLGTP
jgi:NADH:ubiquinone reductase (non-electrogenic)